MVLIISLFLVRHQILTEALRLFFPSSEKLARVRPVRLDPLPVRHLGGLYGDHDRDRGNDCALHLTAGGRQRGGRDEDHPPRCRPEGVSQLSYTDSQNAGVALRAGQWAAARQGGESPS